MVQKANVLVFSHHCRLLHLVLDLCKEVRICMCAQHLSIQEYIYISAVYLFLLFLQCNKKQTFLSSVITAVFFILCWICAKRYVYACVHSICPFRSIYISAVYLFFPFLQCNKMQLSTLLVLAGLVVMASAYVIGRPNTDSEEDQISSTYYHR